MLRGNKATKTDKNGCLNLGLPDGEVDGCVDIRYGRRVNHRGEAASSLGSSRRVTPVAGVCLPLLVSAAA